MQKIDKVSLILAGIGLTADVIAIFTFGVGLIGYQTASINLQSVRAIGVVAVLYGWFIAAWFTHKRLYENNRKSRKRDKAQFTIYSSLVITIVTGFFSVLIGVLISPGYTMVIAIGFEWWFILLMLVYAQPLFYPGIYIEHDFSGDDSNDFFVIFLTIASIIFFGIGMGVLVLP